jgi:hypothetical protein
LGRIATAGALLTCPACEDACVAPTIEAAPLSRDTAAGSDYAVTRVAVVLGTALASVVAFAVTAARCGGVAPGPLQWRSRYCRALNLPGRPESPTSSLPAGLILVLPVCLAIEVSSARVRVNDDEIPRRFGIGIGVLLVLSFILVAFAGYHASGLTD